MRTTQDDTKPLVSWATGATRAATASLLRQRRRYGRQLVDPREAHLLQHLRDVTQEGRPGLCAGSNDVVERLGQTTRTTVPVPTFLYGHPDAIQPPLTPSVHPA
jgi:hypothetical protein